MAGRKRMKSDALRPKSASVAKEALHAHLAKAAAEDINLFAEYVFQVEQAQCHRDIQKHVDDHDRAGIIAHKELGKTTQVLMLVLWWLGRNPELRIKVVCSNDDSAVDRVMLLRDYIDRNERLRRVFPKLVKNPHVDDWGKHSLTVLREQYQKDSSIEACGVLTSATGSRADLILFDDVVDLQNAIKYPSLRKDVKMAFKNVWMAMLGPKGRAVYLATRHHEDDLTSEIFEGKSDYGKWVWLDMSVKGEPPVSPWPEQWSTEALEKKQSDIGTIEFDRCFRNILHPEGEQIIMESWIVRYRDEKKEERATIRIVSWDLAAGDSGPNDFIARAVLDLWKEERLFKITDVRQVKGLTYNKMVEEILMDFAEVKPDYLCMENSAFQVIVGRDERFIGMPLELRTPSLSKEMRVRQTARFYERSRIVFLQDRCELAIKQLLAFPNGKHDDMVDAITQGILFGIEKMGMIPDLSQVKAKGERAFGIAGTAESPHARNPSDGEGRVRRAQFRNVSW